MAQYFDGAGVSSQESEGESLEFLQSQLPVKLFVAVPEDRPAVLNDVECEYLPWMAENSSFRSRVNRLLEEFYDASGGNDYWEGADVTRPQLTRVIEEFLREWHIDVSAEVHVELQLRDRSLTNLKSVASLYDWVTYKSYEEYVVENCEELESAKLVDNPDLIKFSPIPANRNLMLQLSPSQDFLLQRVSIAVGDGTVASRDVNRVMSAGTEPLKLPRFPVAEYARLREADKNIDVELEVGKGSNTRSISLPYIDAEVETLTSRPVSIYFDMGSSQSKVFNFECFGPSLTEVASEEERRDRIERKLSTIFEDTKSPNHVGAQGPMPTEDCLQTFGLPRYDKSRIVSLGEGALVDWIVQAVDNLAASAAQQGRHLVSVCWSFPEIENMNVDAVAHAVREKADKYLLGSCHVISENEALKHRFGTILNELADRAREKKKERDKAKLENAKRAEKRRAAEQKYRKEKEEYEETFAVKRWFMSEPERPDLSKYKNRTVPELEEWHEEFVELEIDKDLTNILILDVGGYSVDAVLRVEGNEYLESFEAGGHDLTEKLREFLTDQSGREYSFEEAEAKKIDICRSHSDPRHDHTKFIKRQTQKIYGSVLEGIADWVEGANASGNASVKALPVILTGGASHNPFFGKLVHQKFSEANIGVKFTNALELTEQIIEADLEEERWNRFASISCSFKPESSPPRAWYDVVGGQVEAHLCEVNENR